jgi:hypothetical protein
MTPITERNDLRNSRHFSTAPTRARFPKIECNYQTFSIDRYYGGSTGSSPRSFLNISRDYFQREARRNFLAEVAFFVVIAAILTEAFIHGARVIIHFLRLPPA